jgi:hypothetical protein
VFVIFVCNHESRRLHWRFYQQFAYACQKFGEVRHLVGYLIFVFVVVHASYSLPKPILNNDRLYVDFFSIEIFFLSKTTSIRTLWSSIGTRKNLQILCYMSFLMTLFSKHVTFGHPPPRLKSTLNGSKFLITFNFFPQPHYAFSDGKFRQF